MALFSKELSDEDKQGIIDELARQLLENDELLSAALKKVLAEDPVIEKVKTRAQREAEEPWVEIKGLVMDPALGVKIDLDWNAGFILYLKQQGYNGSTDDEIIQRYLAYLSADIHSQMSSDEERYD